MANVQRTLWAANTQEANSTIKFMKGIKAVLSGTFPIFWPMSADGTTYRGEPVVEYRVRTTTGNDVSVANLAAFNLNGITISVGDSKGPAEWAQRYVTITGGTTVGITEISVIVKASVDMSFVGLADRVAALEASSGGSAPTQGVAVPDASGTTVASANATINALLASLRDAGVIAS